MTEPGRPLEATSDPILVVDDDPAVRSLFARALRDAGYDTLEAADGVEALKLLDRRRVALILLDSTMPRLDGAAVIRAVRERAATRTLPVILVTGKADLEYRIEGLEAGADDYLAKPVALEELVARVHAQLRNHAVWTQAIERDADERRRMTAALRRVGGDESPELRARSLVKELMPVLGLDALALLAFTPDGRAIPLAMGGSQAVLGRLGRAQLGQDRLGIALERSLADTLRARAREGPWVQRLAESREIRRPADSLEIAAVPIPGQDGPLGLVFFGASSDRPGGSLARRMPLLLEVADASALLLRSVLETDQDLLRARSSLRAIIAHQAFTPHFQPLVSLADRATVGFEAITRFADGIAPDIHFVEAARVGLGAELELASLRAAVQAAASLPRTAFLSLNVSPSLVLSAQDLGPALAPRGRELVLELTEHAPVDDYEALRAALERIDPPVKVAVDDAGSGYASLRHVLALRPAYVKLDISWIRDIQTDPARQALIVGLVHFAAEAGCQLIGEGIETEAELLTLRQLGLTLGQGYLLGHPMPAPASAPSGGGDALPPDGTGPSW